MRMFKGNKTLKDQNREHEFTLRMCGRSIRRPLEDVKKFSYIVKVPPTLGGNANFYSSI